MKSSNGEDKWQLPMTELPGCQHRPLDFPCLSIQYANSESSVSWSRREIIPSDFYSGAGAAVEGWWSCHCCPVR